MKKYPKKRPFLSTRSGNSGVRRLAQTWSGDNFTSFHDLRFCHYVGMTMSLSGFYFYGHDLGGFSGEMPCEELLLRWMQHGVFEPRFTIHSWNGDGSATMPWSYESGLCGAKAILRQRKSLIPYLYNKIEQNINFEKIYKYNNNSERNLINLGFISMDKKQKEEGKRASRKLPRESRSG